MTPDYGCSACCPIGILLWIPSIYSFPKNNLGGNGLNVNLCSLNLTCTLCVSEPMFLTKLGHKFGKFRLHGEPGSMSAPAYNGGMGHMTTFHIL